MNIYWKKLHVAAAVAVILLVYMTSFPVLEMKRSINIRVRIRIFEFITNIGRRRSV